MTFKIGPIILFCIQNPIVIFKIGLNIVLSHFKYSTVTKYRLFLSKSYFDSQNWAIYHFLSLEIGPIIAFLHSKYYCKIQNWAEYCFFYIFIFYLGPNINFFFQNPILFNI